MRSSAQTEKIPQKQAGILKKCLPASAVFLCLFPGRKKEYNGESGYHKISFRGTETDTYILKDGGPEKERDYEEKCTDHFRDALRRVRTAH